MFNMIIDFKIINKYLQLSKSVYISTLIKCILQEPFVKILFVLIASSYRFFKNHNIKNKIYILSFFFMNFKFVNIKLFHDIHRTTCFSDSIVCCTTKVLNCVHINCSKLFRNNSKLSPRGNADSSILCGYATPI